MNNAMTSKLHVQIQVAITVALAAMLCGTTAQAQAPETLKVGLAVVDITPEGSVYMRGFSGRDKKPSEGVYKEITASCIVFDNGETRAGIVAVNVCRLGKRYFDRLHEIGETFGIPFEHLLINVSHTHCGPHVDTNKNAEYVEKIFEPRLLSLIEKAVADLQEASLDYTVGSCSIAVNRRQLGADGKVVAFAPEPRKSIDPDVPIMRVLTPDGKVRAVLFGYACHPTTMGGYLIGPDYPGFAKDWIAAAYPECLPIFLQGCGGDIKSRYTKIKQPIGDPTKAEGRFGHVLLEPVNIVAEIGHTLGRAVITATCVPPQPVGTYLGGIFDDLSLPDRKEPETASHPNDVQVLRIGDIYIIGMYSEICVDIGLQIKRELAGLKVWTNGYSHWGGGYLTNAQGCEEGGYEANNWFHPTAADIMMKRVVEMTRELAARTDNEK